MASKQVDYIFKKKYPHKYTRNIMTEIIINALPQYHIANWSWDPQYMYVDISQCPNCQYKLPRCDIPNSLIDLAYRYCECCHVKIIIKIKQHSDFKLPGHHNKFGKSNYWRYESKPSPEQIRFQNDHGQIEKEFRTKPNDNLFFPEAIPKPNINDNFSWLRASIRQEKLAKQIKKLEQDKSVQSFNITGDGEITDIKRIPNWISDTMPKEEPLSKAEQYKKEHGCYPLGYMGPMFKGDINLEPFEMVAHKKDIENTRGLSIDQICEMTNSMCAIDKDGKVYFAHRDSDSEIAKKIREINGTQDSYWNPIGVVTNWSIDPIKDNSPYLPFNRPKLRKEGLVSINYRMGEDFSHYNILKQLFEDKEKEPMGTFVTWVDKEKGLCIVKPFTPKEVERISKEQVDKKLSEGMDMFNTEDYNHN